MNSDELPKQIELLVNSLRKQNSSSLSLADIASVTEILIATMQSYFRNVDTSIYRECRALTDYISNARLEIASLQPGNLEDTHIPRAGMELDAIVQATETATNTIMQSAEDIMSADPSDSEAYQAVVNDSVMNIFEACSFQDITGQRISKVVHTLAHIETRILDLRSLLGVTEDDMASSVSEDTRTEDEKLLSGPALEGEGMEQSEIDNLLGEKPQQEAAKVEVEAKPEPAPAPPPAPAPAPAPKPQAKAPPPKPKPAPPKKVNPKVLDTMFEEDFDPLADLEAKKADGADEVKSDAVSDKAEETKKADVAKDGGKTDALKDKGEEVSQDDIDALFG